MKKQLWCTYALGAGMLLLLLFPISASAETNVLDCLEKDEGCNEEEGNTNNEQPEVNEEDTITDNNENAFLVEEEDASGSSMGWQMVRLVLGLALVLGLVYVVLKFLGKRNGFNQQPGILRHVGGVSVGSNKSVQIIRAGNKYYLIGVGDNVELLEEIDDPESIEQLLNQSAEQDKGALSFFSKEKNTKGDAASSGESFQQLLSKELSSIRKNRRNLIHKRKDDADE